MQTTLKQHSYGLGRWTGMMTIFHLGWILAVVTLQVTLLPITAGAAAGPKIDGAFIQLPGKTFQFDGKKVEVVEYLSFYCGHCYAFENAIPIIRGTFPKKISWKVVPIYWGNGSPKPGEAFLLAEEAGKGDKMKAELFKAGFEEHKDIGQLDVLEKIGSTIGMGFDFSVRLRSGEKSKAVQKALDMSKENGVEETPSLIIAGNVLTFPSMTHGDIQNFTQNVITIIGGILK